MIEQLRKKHWNYLRVRGEYSERAKHACSTRELPPRARRIRGHDTVVRVKHGTTSACAENTLTLIHVKVGSGNYLRVRGEYAATTPGCHANRELPPRARRILVFAVIVKLAIGTTSACAENTNTCGTTHYRGWNYLRVRGEYACPQCDAVKKWELPPRARRIRLPAPGE